VACVVLETMLRPALILLCIALTQCARQGPPAPLLSCRATEGTIAIDGIAQPAISTYCRNDQGEVTLGH
jgi:hypothetical protein